MVEIIYNNLNWIPGYCCKAIVKRINYTKPKHIYFSICDHFEPYWRTSDDNVAVKRINTWLENYPKVADRYVDSDKTRLKYTFFYPEEEYRLYHLNLLSELCNAGYGEVEIHLHHDNDTPIKMSKKLTEFKNRLHEKHGLLSINKDTNHVSYGFIHGNWALCNSRPDGKWCGVNSELTVLLQTGCYADFTMPSAPDVTQTKKINSLYYATDHSGKAKSHDSGVDVGIGQGGSGLLMVQGPLGLNFNNRKYKVFPRIENGGIYGDNLLTKNRVRSWVDAGICVIGAEEHVFVKIYTHGTQEKIMQMLFRNNGFDILFEELNEYANYLGARLHFVSAREMVNTILSIQCEKIGDFNAMRDYLYVRTGNNNRHST